MYRRASQGWQKHWEFILMDLACLHAAWVIAYVTRHGHGSPYTDSDYVSLCFVAMLADLVLLLFCGTLKDIVRRGWRRELIMTARQTALTALTVAFYLFSAHRAEQYSRLFFFLMVAIYGTLSFATRMLRKAQIWHRQEAKDGSPLYLVTTSQRMEGTVREARRACAGRYRLAGMAVTDRDLKGQEVLGVPVLAQEGDIAEGFQKEWVEEVLVDIPLGDPSMKDILQPLSEMGIVTHVNLPQVRMQGGQEQFVEEFGDGLVLTTSIRSVSAGQALVKRGMDILAGLAGCAITGILFLVIGPMIKHASPGPVFFSQVRVGRNGKKFHMYKFRSMYMNAESEKQELARAEGIEDQMMFKLDWDPRIIGSKVLPDGTRKKGIGNYIREWSLDEFPQFFNVLKGDMSLVGTRPPTVDEWEKYEPRHRARLSIRPGITGLWQVSGRSQITDFEEVVRLDKKYISEWSIGLDIKILLQTVKVLLKRDGAM